LMCVDSLLLKFNSDEKQFTQLYISVFASDCILSRTILVTNFQKSSSAGGFPPTAPLNLQYWWPKVPWFD